MTTALARLRTWFAGEERLSKAAWSLGDTTETRAILELADRLDKIEADPSGALASLARYRLDTETPPIGPLVKPNIVASPQEPFRITAPGQYQLRNGKAVNIVSVKRGWFDPQWQWTTKDKIDSDQALAWRSDGTISHDRLAHEHDIVAGPVADKPGVQLAQMSGWLATDRSGISAVLTDQQEAQDWAGPAGLVVDLSTIRRDQLLRYGPVPDMRTVTLGLFKSGEVRVIQNPSGRFLPGGCITTVDVQVAFPADGLT